jgi:Flp pilus assembly pilin Flp
MKTVEYKLKPKSKLGQNTAEYMLLLLLIGGGSIMAFKTFGKGIINRFASVTSIVTGGAAVNGNSVTTEAQNMGNSNVDFTTFDSQGQ